MGGRFEKINRRLGFVREAMLNKLVEVETPANQVPDGHVGFVNKYTLDQGVQTADTVVYPEDNGNRYMVRVDVGDNDERTLVNQEGDEFLIPIA